MNDNTFHLKPWHNSPFAWDFAYDNETVLTPYDQTSSYSFYFHVFFNFSFVLGAVCSFTLLYLVLFHSKGSLKTYTDMLLLCCAADLNYWFFDHMAHLQSTGRDGIFMAKLNGLARYLNWHGQIIMFGLLVNAILLSNTILPAQAYCRYYCLKYDTPMTNWQTVRMFGYSLFASIQGAIAAFFSCYYSPTSMPGVNYGTYWFHERPLPIVMYTDIRNFYQKYYFLCATLVVSIAYLLTVYYSYLTYVCLEKNKNAYTAKTLKINKQLSICMLCQVICSLTVGCAPVLVFTIPTFLYADSGISTWICGVILSFVPICNPIVTIIIMKPYRETLLRIVCRRKINNTGSSSFGGVTDTSINTSKI